MSKESLLRQIAANPRLPSPPSITFQILDKVNSPRCTIGEISKLISQDPPLCGRILKLVNSSLYGLPRAVTSIQAAVNLLGLKRVRSLVLSLALPSMQADGKTRSAQKDFWRLAVASGIVARELAQRLGSSDADSEMVCGLLADLGVLVMEEVFPEEYGQVLAYPLQTILEQQCQLEEKHVGLNHAEVSAHILSTWRLPEEMTRAIEFHHQPELAPKPVSDRAHLLFFAHRVAQLQFSTDIAVNVGEIMTLATQRFGMSDRAFRDFLAPLAERINELSSLLEVNAGGCESFSDLLARATENLTRIAVETSLDNVRVEGEKQLAVRELRKTEEALQKAEEKLRQAVKLEAIGRLAGGIAHDFNNLLTVINGCSELMLGLMTELDPHRQFVEEIKKSADRATDLTRQLLAFSRKQILVPKVLNLNEVVVGMQKMLRRLIGEDIELTTSLDEELAAVLVDPGQMDQVILNLVVNARDAMPRGGKLILETRNVELDDSYVQPLQNGLRSGPYVLLAISDTGIGMSDEVKANIFEPFFSTKGEGNGTGLGLATVHGIVTQSGGHVAVYSEAGRGSTFKVYLPALLDPSEYQPPSPIPSPSRSGSETILLTEDEEGVRRMVRRMLETYGYHVLEASDGEEAIRICKDFPGGIHLLLTDIVMPVMSGSELAKRLLEMRPKLRVLYTSGYTDDAIVRHGVLTSEAAFLQKPFTPQALTAKIRELLYSGAAMSAVPSNRFPGMLDDAAMSPG